MWSCNNVGGLGAHVICHLFGFLVYLKKIFFCFILWLAPSPQKWSDFDDLYVIRRVSAQGSAFWGLVHTAPPILGVKSPKNPILWAWIGIFKLNMQNINTCILSTPLHWFQPNFAQWQWSSNTHKTNPRWQTATILKKLQNGHISATVSPISMKFGTVMHIGPAKRTRIYNFQLLKIQDGGRI